MGNLIFQRFRGFFVNNYDQKKKKKRNLRIHSRFRIEKLGNIGTNIVIPCRKWHVQFTNTEGDLVAGSCQASYKISVTGVEICFSRLAVTCSDCRLINSLLHPMSHPMHTLPSYN